MNKPIYLLVADRGQAKIFNTDSQMHVLDLVFEEIDPSARKTRAELESDRPGRTSDSSGHLHALGDSHSAERHNTEQFAKYLCDILNKDLQEKKFRELMIAAPPHFLGHLRHNLSGECRNALGATIDKDLLHSSGADIAAHFKARRAVLNGSRVAI